jgi:hypothetical protein
MKSLVFIVLILTAALQPTQTLGEKNETHDVPRVNVAPVRQAAVEVSPLPRPTPTPQLPRGTAPNTGGSCVWANHTSDPASASYIFTKESGCRPEAVNPTGCRGLGQACPGSKLPCSSSDGACQARYFENYAKSRYGGWQQALAFHRSHGWW